MSSQQNYHKFQIIIRDEASKPEEHGAEELKRYMRKMLGPASISIHREGKRQNNGIKLLIGKTHETLAYLKEKGIDLEKKLDEDGFILASGIKKGRRFVVLCGRRERGTLYSIYTFLEKQGCRFFEPYHLGEIIPGRKSLIINDFLEIRNPTLGYRDLIFDDNSEWNIIENIRILDWAVKNKLNTIVLALAGNNFTKFLPALVSEVKKRDLTLGMGGHFIFSYLMLPEEILRSDFPTSSSRLYKELLKRHPDWAKLPSAEDWDIYHYKHTVGPDPCLSNPEVVERISRNLIIFLKYHPEFELVRFMVADRFFNPKNRCNCKKCFQKRKSLDGYDKNHLEDIYLEAVKVIAGESKKELPQVSIGYTCLTTFGFPSIYSGHKKLVEMPENVKYFYVCLEWQNYNYSLFSESYDQPSFNPITHYDMVKWWVSQLQRAGRKLIVKEMHGSGYYYGLLRNTPQVIAENTRWLNSFGHNVYAGSMMVANLVAQDHALAWHSFGLNLYVYYRLAWNINEDVERLLADFFDKYFAEVSPFMKKIYNLIEEKASHLIFNPFADCSMRWRPIFSRKDKYPWMFHEATDKYHRSEKALEFYSNILKETESCQKYLDKAKAGAKDKEIIDRVEMDIIGYRYLINFLRYTFGLYKAGYFYRKSLKAPAGKEKQALLMKAKEELKQSSKVFDILNKIGLGGYQGLERFRQTLQAQSEGVEKTIKALSKGRR